MGDETTVAALVFVPGMSRSWSGQSLGNLAEDIGVSLDQASAKFKYSVAAGPALEYGVGSDSRSAHVVTISRGDESGTGEMVPVLDVIEVPYIRALAEQQERKSLVERIALVLLGLVRGSRQFLAILTPFRSGKTFAEKVQIVYAAVVLLLYAFLLAVLVIELIVLVVNAFQSVRDAATTGTGVVTPMPSVSPSPIPAGVDGGSPSAAASNGVIGGVWDAFIGFWSSVLGRVVSFVPLVGAVLWMWLPPKAKIKQALTDSATDYLAVDFYLRAGMGAQRLTGDMIGLLDAIRDQARYRRVDVASYSFGSILAFNAFFPFGNAPQTAGPIPALRTLVTIGCPFDTVRLVRPNYFKDRQWPTDPHRPTWINVFTPNDILGSNFRDDGKVLPPDDKAFAKATGQPPANAAVASPHSGPVVPVNVAYYPGGVPLSKSPLDILVLNGFRAHTQYWDPGSSGEETAWDLVVQALYEDDPILGPSVATPPAGPSSAEIAEPNA